MKSASFQKLALVFGVLLVIGAYAYNYVNEMKDSQKLQDIYMNGSPEGRKTEDQIAE
jgi:hypothetical protein